MLQYLLDENVDDLFETGELGRTPFLSACSAKSGLKKLKILVDNDANINVKDDNSDNCLTITACDGDSKMLDFLIENGADVDKKGAGEKTALLSACCLPGNLENLRFLLKETDSDKKGQDSDGDNCMTLVCEFGDFMMLKCLIENGVNVDEVGFEGRTGLMKLCCEKGNSQKIKYLLDKKANAGKKDDSGNTALTLAVEFGDLKMIEVLLAHGVSVEQKGAEGRTAL